MYNPASSSPAIAQPVVAVPAMYVTAVPVDVQVQASVGQKPAAQAKVQRPSRFWDRPEATVPALQLDVVDAVEEPAGAVLCTGEGEEDAVGEDDETCSPEAETRVCEG